MTDTEKAHLYDHMLEVAKASGFDCLTAAIVAGSQRDAKWQDVETAPFGKTVLLGWRDWRDHQWCMEVAPYSHGRRVGETSSVSCHGSATHWMPLPTPPIPAETVV